MSADGAGATFYDDELAARYSHLLDPLVAELRAFARDDERPRELARRTHGVVMLEGTPTGQAFPEASFDVVVMHDVLEHLLEPVDELSETHRVLRPGGFLAVETLTASSLDLHEQGIGWSLMNPLCHVNFLDERNGARALREAGFRILDFYSPHEDNWISYAEAA